MAEISKISVKDTDGIRRICVWTDEGGVTVCRETPENRAALDRWMNGELDDDGLFDALDGAAAVQAVAKKVNFKLERINPHITTDGIHVYYDGDTFEHLRIDPTLEAHLIKLLTHRDTPEGRKDLESWAAFAVNLYANVTPYIREQLVRWMKAQDWLSFSADGCLIGYRGGQKNEATGIAESVHEGPAIVNDEMVNGHVPNPDGAIVEMPRGQVHDNTAVGCASGLHVGTFDYAVGWAPYDGVVMRVKVDPKDIVSVPLDCNAQKIRCCRFEVLDHIDKGDPAFRETVEGWGEDWTYPEDDEDDWGDDWESEWSDDGDEDEEDWDEIAEEEPEGESQPEDEKAFDIIITGFGANKLDVIRAVYGLTPLSLAETKTLLESCPVKVVSGVGKGLAEEIKAKLEAAGATATISDDGEWETSEQASWDEPEEDITYTAEELEDIAASVAAAFARCRQKRQAEEKQEETPETER